MYSGHFLGWNWLKRIEKSSSGSLNRNLQSANTYSHQHCSTEVPKCRVRHSDLVSVLVWINRREQEMDQHCSSARRPGRRGGPSAFNQERGYNLRRHQYISTMVNPGFCRELGFFMDGITHCVRENYFLCRILVRLQQKCGWKETHRPGEVSKANAQCVSPLTPDRTEKPSSSSLPIFFLILFNSHTFSSFQSRLPAGRQVK